MPAYTSTAWRNNKETKRRASIKKYITAARARIKPFKGWKSIFRYCRIKIMARHY